jgi:hypothetical protein
MNPNKRSAKSAAKSRLQEAPVPLSLPHAPASGLPLLASQRHSATQDYVQPSATPAVVKRFVTEQLLPQRSSKPKPNSRKTGHKYSAAAAAAVLFAISVVGAALSPQIASSYSLGTWSTAVLSAPRYSLAATSLPNLGVSIFAGGYSECWIVHLSCCKMRCFVRRMYKRQELCVLDKCSCLTTCADGSQSVVAVDIFNAIEGTWSTGNLSLARSFFAATSLPNFGVAIFAGGLCACCHVRFDLLQNVLLCEKDA